MTLIGFTKGTTTRNYYINNIICSVLVYSRLLYTCNSNYPLRRRYAVIENMRHLLSPFNASTPLYLGSKFKPEGGYMGGGSGYILTKEAITRFVEIGLNFKHSEIGNNSATKNISSQQLCKKGHEGPEDIFLGKYVRFYIVNKR
jgi:hypothetical protein